MTRDEAHEALLQLAAGVRAADDAPGVLLRHVVEADDEGELHAALLEAGAAAAVAAARERR